MQNGGRNKSGGEAEKVTYSRGDTGLWDDAYLIQLWNEQLELIKNKGAMELHDSEEGNRSEVPEEEDEDSVEEDSKTSSESGRDHTRDSAEDGDDSGGASREEEPMGCGRAFHALAAAASSSTDTPHPAHVGESPSAPPAGRVAPADCPLPVSHLPDDIQGLVASFYAAGFEAGKYAATHASTRKRGRD